MWQVIKKMFREKWSPHQLLFRLPTKSVVTRHATVMIILAVQCSANREKISQSTKSSRSFLCSQLFFVQRAFNYLVPLAEGQHSVHWTYRNFIRVLLISPHQRYAFLLLIYVIYFFVNHKSPYNRDLRRDAQITKHQPTQIVASRYCGQHHDYIILRFVQMLSDSRCVRHLSVDD